MTVDEKHNLDIINRLLKALADKEKRIKELETELKIGEVSIKAHTQQLSDNLDELRALANEARELAEDNSRKTIELAFARSVLGVRD